MDYAPAFNHLEPVTTLFRRPILIWGAVFVCWTVLGLLSVLQTAIYLEHLGEPIRWGELAFSRLSDWYTCAAFTPAYVWLVRRYPIDRQHWRAGVPVHLVATTIFVVIKYAALVQLRDWLTPEARRRSFSEMLAGNFISESIAFWAVIGVVHAVEFYLRFRQRETQALQLQAQLVEARLDALSAQLHPHFLFNTLNAIKVLMRRDPDGAEAMLTSLGDLLRHTLRRGERHEVTLAEELELLDEYLQIMQVRFRDRLGIRMDVDPSLSRALLPHFILQPLVENALQHGIARRAGAGQLEIAALRAGDALRMTVSDDGAGLGYADRSFPKEGIGLGNTRRRLQQLYGHEFRLALEEGAEGGLRVVLEIPFREVAAETETVEAQAALA